MASFGVRRSFLFGILGLVGLMSSACVSKPAPLYTPSSLVTGRGDIQVSTFRYLPAEQGKVGPNQVRNTAIGSLKIAENIDAYFTNAMLSELKYAGYRIGQGDAVLTGDIQDFLADDLGYNVDWKLVAVYRLKRADQTVYEKRVEVAHRTPKLVEPFAGFNKTFRLAFEALMKDPEIGQHLTAK